MSVLWTRDALQAATGGRFMGRQVDRFRDGGHADITGISIDTRTLRPGDLFIALKGDSSDGHAHIATALEKGAAAVMAHDGGSLRDGRILLVGDTMVGLQDLAVAARARFTGKVAAITGSVGKTTTKDMLRLCLQATGPTHAAEASYNNHWGVPLTLARLPRDAAFCISEIGMNHPGEILPLARMVRPDVAVITTIGSAHLGHMGSLDAIAAEKASLMTALAQGGIAIIPDDAHGPDILADTAQKAGAVLWPVGARPESTVHFTHLHTGADGSDFTVVFTGPKVEETLDVHLGAPGLHLVRNAVAALAACAALGANTQTAAAALAAFQPGRGRGALTRIAGGDVTLLDESYNASAASVRAALDVLRHIPASRRIAVLGDMRELGDFSTTEHGALAEPAAMSADLVFCCGPHMKTLFEALPPERRGVWAPTAAALAPDLCAAIRKGDAIVVKGSLGSRMRDVIDALQALGPMGEG
ncbi:UDP-N-acetylmuramoyl-tripeptide--D-alanyl-D-alanine ligase [Acetobacter sp. TBRC 12305]|uniref:UDP-N-acetylmuramoyl-tripeptide--D-alanyl-D-alanine ligase n=1 Tax=Acetobacter garciniae TaxID=2817435 RepID=A0A939HQC9_9PROT|nr:UDP-N-acetylmuramoyl-tripeptide--D-alanyl-D-alanine ligase [Acetobacter garciniae]MBO1326429.1 UDP-N-acetylmuramoyl-tripeptide--D-alanyl-D-alanine ligase [Acetobacter garciniae]MBX0346116.1 UDP-N-acetylmuramoyl-tripeptide--D-alanyl-D-alanine ligase [Acetobacter garciniae]